MSKLKGARAEGLKSRMRLESRGLPTPARGALIDSGADESVIDWELAKLLNLKAIPLVHPINASALDGRLIC